MMNNSINTTTTAIPKPFIEDDATMGYPRICAHRGFKTVAPENTLPAFGAAIALGAPEIELDVRFSKDGIPVVSHDDRLDRVSNGTGVIQDFTFEELRKFDFGIRFNPHFEGLRIASFEEVLAKFSRQAIINLHVKSTNEMGTEPYPKAQFLKIVELLDKYDQRRHTYFMATAEIMELALEYAPDIRRCMSSDPDRWAIVDRAIKYKCHKVQLFKPCYNQEMIDKAHANGIRCNFFWSDDLDEARKLLDMGVDTILTNDYLNISRVLAG